MIDKLKYQIINDVAFGQKVLFAADSVSDECVSIAGGVGQMDIFTEDPDLRAQYRKITRYVDHVSVKKSDFAELADDKDLALLILEYDNFAKYIGLVHTKNIIFPFYSLDSETAGQINRFAGNYPYSYRFLYSKKGLYAGVFLIDRELQAGDSGIVIFSQNTLTLNNSYSCYVALEDSADDVRLQNELRSKKNETSYLYSEINRFQRNSYLLVGPLLAVKRLAIKILMAFPPTRLLGKTVKALREGGFSTLTARMRSYLGLKQLNGAVNYSSLFSDRTEYVDVDSEYQRNMDFSAYKTDVKMLAYYLPQYHTFPENDEWWGKGFTEWSNTRVATPRFKSHYQPRIPHADIGYYDLSDIETLKKQAALAKQHGIYGFCFYYYWFSGKRLMEKPVDMLLEHPEIDLPFCLCWANENWTRAWDGQQKNILIAQEYSDRDDDRFIVDMKKYIDDSRYIRINGKPLIVVYNPGEIPNCKKSFDKWREVAKSIGLGEILIWTCQTANNTAQKLNIEDCIDAEVEFPPHNTWLDAFAAKDIDLNGRSARLFNYQKLVKGLLYNYKIGQDKETGSRPLHHACMMAWDNAARRKDNWFTYHYFSLKSLYDWTCLICEQARRDFDESERFVFVNAWNEWAEGTYLEPDHKYGYANINTVSKALIGLPLEDDLEVIQDEPEHPAPFSGKIAVQVHMFYTETLGETIENLNKIPYPFDCFVSTDTQEKAGYIRAELENKCKCSRVVVELFENRGRDVAPFLAQMHDRIDDYDYVCHIHSKRTVTGDHGNDWRRYTFKHLFGNERYLRSVFDLFSKDDNLGLLFPETFPPIEYQAEWGGNLTNCTELMESLDIETPLPQNPVFPVGNMFWARSEAIRPLFKLNLKAKDFPEEMRQTNATIAHCIERCWVYIAAEYGFGYKKIFNDCENDCKLSEKRRIAFYVHYSKENSLSQTDYDSLLTYSKLFDDIVLISNSPIGEADEKKLDTVVSRIYKRENHGMDFGGWKYGLEQFGYDKLSEYDEIILVNNSTFKPILDFKPVFAEMDRRSDDFWGLTLFPSISDGSYLGKKRIPEHLQSYFIVFEKPVIESGEIQKFFDSLKLSDNFTETVANGEVNLTVHMKNCGFTYSAYLRECTYLCQYLMNFSLPYDKPATLLLLGSPLVKKKAYQHMTPAEKEKLQYLIKKFSHKA